MKPFAIAKTLLMMSLSVLFTIPAQARDVRFDDIDDDENQSVDTDYSMSANQPIPAGQSIRVNLASQELRTYEDGRLVKTYKVAVGAPDFKSPQGERAITKVVWNPWWNPPKHSAWAQDYQSTPPGAENPMGPVKMDIGSLYFIHGNNDPISIGHAVTHGCIRLLDEDAEEVARRIQHGAAMGLNWSGFEGALARGAENYQVNLSHPVPVLIYDDLVELKDGKLYVYKDVYERYSGHDRLKLVQDELASMGISPKNIRGKMLARDVKSMEKFKWFALTFSKYVKGGVSSDHRVAYVSE